MFINYKCSVTGYIAGDFFLSFFVNETAEAANVNVFSAGHVLLDYAKESFNRSGNIRLVHACLFSNFVDYVCFGHNSIFKVS